MKKTHLMHVGLTVAAIAIAGLAMNALRGQRLVDDARNGFSN
jgi:hypothetical protein